MKTEDIHDKKYTNIRPTMFRALSNLSEYEKEYNDKIIKTGIVPPTEKLSGSGYGKENPVIYGSAWTLNHEYITKMLYTNFETHSILKKKINIECKNGNIEITDPKGCHIEENELEGVMIICTKPIKFDSADVTGNPIVSKNKK